MMHISLKQVWNTPHTTHIDDLFNQLLIYCEFIAIYDFSCAPAVSCESYTTL